MLNGGLSWNLFFYVEFAFALGLLVFAFFVVEETAYDRPPPNYYSETDSPTTQSVGEKPMVSAADRPMRVIPQRKTFVQQLKFWGVHNKDSDFFIMMARSFTYYLVPQVFWVVTTYGKLLYCMGSTAMFC